MLRSGVAETVPVVAEEAPPSEIPEPEVTAAVAEAPKKTRTKAKIMETLTAIGLGATTLFGI